MRSKATKQRPRTQVRQGGLLVTIAILLGVVTGLTGAILVVTGGTIPTPVQAGAVAFSSTVPLVIGIMLAIRRL